MKATGAQVGKFVLRRADGRRGRVISGKLVPAPSTGAQVQYVYTVRFEDNTTWEGIAKDLKVQFRVLKVPLAVRT
jgi:hypothetical protein